MRDKHTIIAARVGGRLKELRGGQTQAEYAQRLGLSQAQYNRYETGKRLAPDPLLQKAAELAGLSPEQVALGNEPPQAQSSGPPPGEDYAQAVAELVRLMDREGQEDLYYFLKAKIEDLARKRRKEMKKALEALEGLRNADTG